MRGTVVSFIVVALLAWSAFAQPVYFQLATHNEAPHIPDTPNFTDVSAQASYVVWRNALKDFAEMCVARGIAYNCECEWNFLEGVLKWEVNTNTAIAGITTNTQNKNILRYIYDLGVSSNVPVEIDPHSHEGSGYTYADVAWLASRCATNAPVVGGSLWNGATSTAIDFDRMSATGGVVATKYANAPNWFPKLMMGLATANHVNDPHDAGLWRPAAATNYYTVSSNGPMAAIGNWQTDLFETERLLSRLESGEIPKAGKFWATGIVMSQRDFIDATYRSNTVRAALDTLKRWQDDGRIQTTTFMGAMGIWQTNYASAGNVFQRAADNVSFSLNWQDFHYTNETARYLRDLISLHEQYQVPLDAFFTTWQTDIIEQFPDLMGRVESSSLLAQGYHVRPPKPYADNFIWGPIATSTDKTSIVTSYETHGIDLATGQPTTNSGGFAKITALQGYAPICVGALAQNIVVTNVNGVFSNMGARMFVNHSPPVNVSTLDAITKLPFRPEHWDWKLIALYTTNAADPQPTTLTQALAWARSTSTNGGTAPWFVGVKLHDNDLFASQSEWTLIYSNTASRPWNTSLYASALSPEVQSNRFAIYAAIVADDASRRTNVNAVNTFDTVAFMGDARTRPVGLSRTSLDENQPTGTVLATISGGGIIAGQFVQYSLVSGTGSQDNAQFSISSNRLIAARILNYESNSVLRLRVRWTWYDSLNTTNVLATGERPLTVVLQNVTTDDDDGDGMTEADEAIAGTDPQNAAGVFRVASLASSGTNSIISIGSVTNRFYSLQSSTNLATWLLELNATNIPGTGANISFSDAPPAPPQKFFRVLVNP